MFLFKVDSTTVLALHLLDAQVKHFSSENDWNNISVNNDPPVFRLQSLDNVRHLKIEFFDVWGRLRDSNRADASPVADAPPIWFQRLMSKVSSSLKATRRPIIINNRTLGELVITPDPSYEIAEIWHDTFGLLSLGCVIFHLS